MSAPVVRSLICTVLFVLATAPIASAQQTGIAELLSEVRLLRQTIETITATNIRAQIAFGRLQLQEQRTADATTRLDAARRRLTEIVEEIANFDAAAKEQEEAETARHTEERAMLASMRRESERYRTILEVQRARAVAEEAEAANCLALEQAQWSDLNQRLEELERSLVARRQ